MLRTNSTAAKANIANYIDSFRNDIIDTYIIYDNNIKPEEISTTEALSYYIINIMFYDEMLKHNNAYKARPYSCNLFDFFRSWAQGLSCCGMFDYYYNVPAVDLLGDILEETEAEKSKYTEEQAEELLTKLLYRELKANAAKVSF